MSHDYRHGTATLCGTGRFGPGETVCAAECPQASTKFVQRWGESSDTADKVGKAKGK